MVADSFDDNPKDIGSAEKKKERAEGQFFHVGDNEEQGDGSAKVGAELHPLDFWVLDTGAVWTMTPRKDLLDELRAAPINEVAGASRHALKEAGAGQAAFNGADGKSMVLHDILLIPNLKANLTSLHKLAKAGVSTSMDGAQHVEGAAGQSVEMTSWLKKQGIQRELTMAYIPQSNDVVERASPTIQETARALLIESVVGNSMWPHAVRHATMARKRALTKLPTPPRSIEVSSGRAQSGGGDEESVQEAPAGGGGGEEASGSTSGATGPEGEQQQGKAKAPTLPQRRKPKCVVMKGWETPVYRPGHTCMATMKQTAGADVAEQQPGSQEALLILPQGYDLNKDKPAYCFHASALQEPASMEEALAGPDREKWLASRDAENQSLQENRTWELVVTIYKSRLVANGFMQKQKQDFNEIFASTAKPPTLRRLAAALEEMGFRTSSCDESLFLKGEGEKLVLFQVYVDDILLFSSSMKEIQKVQWLKLHLEKFIKELGEKYGIENERKVTTPLQAEFKLVKAAEDERVEAEEQQQFQSLNPSEEQVEATERVVKNLNSYRSIGVQYSASAQVKQKRVEVLKEKGERLGEGNLFLTCFIDATWACRGDLVEEAVRGDWPGAKGCYAAVL
ncbi:unnamed protein product [Closterium sp. NIES-53]